jgi:hypothetical protein
MQASSRPRTTVVPGLGPRVSVPRPITRHGQKFDAEGSSTVLRGNGVREREARSVVASARAACDQRLARGRAAGPLDERSRSRSAPRALLPCSGSQRRRSGACCAGACDELRARADTQLAVERPDLVRDRSLRSGASGSDVGIREPRENEVRDRELGVGERRQASAACVEAHHQVRHTMLREGRGA